MALRDEIQYAFSKTPYPGNDALTSCNCEECQMGVSRFRGKKWSRLELGDVGDEGGGPGLLTPAAFQYFLPGLMRLVLDHPETIGWLDQKIVGRFVVSDGQPGISAREILRRVEQTIRRLTPRQRSVVAEFVRSLETTGLHVPLVLNSAVENLLGKTVRPYSQKALERWLAEKYGETAGARSKGAAQHRSQKRH